MSAVRLVQRRKKRAANCVTLFDRIVCKSLKLFHHDYTSDGTTLKLIDVIGRCQSKWSHLVDKLGCRLNLLNSELHRLKLIQAETESMFESESERRLQAERSRDKLKRKLDIIREILKSNDVDEAKRRLESIDKSAMSEGKSTRFDHSAGSLLDPINVSGDPCTDEINNLDFRRISQSRRASSAGKMMDLAHGPLRRSTRISKLRCSSVPKIVNSGLLTIDDKRNAIQPLQMIATGIKRYSDKSDDLYFGVDMKRSLLTQPSELEHRLLPSALEEEGSSICSSDVAGINSQGLLRRQVNTNSHTPSATYNRLNRPHTFNSKPVLRMEICSYCGRRITFGKSAFKCVVCRLIVHPACRKQLIQTCVPPSLSRTPLSSFNKRSPRSSPTCAKTTSQLTLTSDATRSKPHQGYPANVNLLSSPTVLSGRSNNRNLNIADFCPEDQYPRIPALVIHCVTEVLARGMQVVGIYRVSGSEKHVHELYEKFFTGKVTPVLARVDDIHVVCGCLKLFLRNLSEPLVTFVERPVLASISASSQLGDENSLQQVVDVLDSLPAPNRDTLSYLMLHLKTVSRTPVCQMGEENLAKVFGPTLVGYSCPEPQRMQIVTETRTQQAVLRLLFSLPDHVYTAILTNPIQESNVAISDSNQDTYFSPVLSQANDLSGQTPTRLGKTPQRTLGMSARKRFFPYFSSHRETNTDSS
ncbi:hypothetical protein AHF37_04498 [Paragonimus kellicotti]|nr:hypothetical protein AHF37_04498 [Paragonimus kellicotti]